VRRAENAGLLYLPERDGRPEGRFCPHVIRHTRATHMLQDGVDIYAVAKLLGDTIRTVETIYGHAATTSTAGAILGSDFKDEEDEG
jgi:integrase